METSMSTECRVHIRWMIRRDMAEVLDIEQLCFPDPYTEDEFVHFLRARNCIGMVCDCEIAGVERVLGFMVYDLHKTRIKLIDFAVLPSFQRMGIGRQMVEKLKGKLGAPKGRSSIEVLISENNLDGQLFFKRMGFRCTDIVRGAYDSTDADGYKFIYRVKK